MADRDPLAPEPKSTVLVAGGLDPSGGAGLVQDVSVVRALGLHPLSVLTTVIVQNTSRVSRRSTLPSRLIQDQLETLTEEFQVGAVKTGSLGSSDIVKVFAAWLAERPRLPVVLDPVWRASSGGELGEPGYADSLARELFPRARVITPNLEEAAYYSGRPVTERDHIPEAAKALLDRGPQWVLIKGGHLARGRATDYLAGPGTTLWMDDVLRPKRTPRGTGCALATALACRLAGGETIPEAAQGAKVFVTQAIDRSYELGEGRFLDFTTLP